MENIYHLLKKHFAKELTPEEEEQIEKFKKNNLQEYKMLSHLWWSSADIQLKKFNSDRAWQKIVDRAEGQKKRSVPFYPLLGRIAAAAAILISITFTVYLSYNKIAQREVVAQTLQISNYEEILLCDGSKVWLNKDTQFKYPKKFSGKQRRVSLKGEAYFEIAKNPDKPFIVQTEHSEIKVLGTSFNVNTHLDQTNVSVRSGRVNVKSRNNPSSADLSPGYMARITNELIQKSKIENINYLSWKTGIFNFKNAALKDVVRDLNSFYDKQIIINNPETDCSFSASFDNIHIEDIIGILELTCDLEITENDDKYEIQ